MRLLDHHDAAQVGLLAMTDADQRYDPDLGVPREGFVYRAAELAITGFMWKSTCPVNLTDYALHKEQRDRPNVSGLTSIPLPGGEPEPEPEFAHTELRCLGRQLADFDVETEFDNGRLRIRVREFLCGIESDEKIAMAAVMAIVGEGTTNDAATIAGVSKKRITQTMDNIRDELMCRPDLWSLWHG